MPARHLAQLSAVAVGVAAAVGMLLLGGLWVHGRPVLHIASTAQECVNAPDHVASLFSNDQSTLIRLSTFDHSDTRVLRVEPASSLPGMFDSLLALSGDSRRLAYVTADDEQMDNARIQYIDVASPSASHLLVSLAQGLAPIRPAWSGDDSQLAYVLGRPAGGGRPAGFEVWSVHGDASLPPQKVSDLPLSVFTHGNSASLCWTSGGQVGLLQGVDAARGQVGPSPHSDPSSAGAGRPSPASSPCGVPVFSQNDPSWRQFVMQAGGDPIGGFGCPHVHRDAARLLRRRHEPRGAELLSRLRR